MISPNSQNKFARFIQKIEFRLILFLSYVVALIAAWVTTGRFSSVVFVHIFFTLLIGIIYFWDGLFMLFFSPMFLFLWPFLYFRTKRYLRQFKQNIPSESVIVLGSPDWFRLEGWIKPIFMKGEIKSLVKFLQAGKKDFSFYTNAKFEDVEKIMSNENIKEVFFFGHGDSHSFELNTEEILFYCDFNNERYKKEFVHQVHCGTKNGKSLINYVVPKENQAKCFFFRKPINGLLIKKEFKKRLEMEIFN